jgi:hypothetical protein
MGSLILALIIVSGAGCQRRADLKTVVAPGGLATAHFHGEVPTGDPGEPAPLPEYGVESLDFTFAGDDGRHRFTSEGELYFSDWRFDVFSADGAYTALLESHYGPLAVVPTSELRRFLDGATASAEFVAAPPTESGIARVVEQWRWSGPRELELRVTCCGDTQVVRRRIGDPRAPQ